MTIGEADEPTDQRDVSSVAFQVMPKKRVPGIMTLIDGHPWFPNIGHYFGALMDISQALLDGRKPISETTPSHKTGLYGIFAKDRKCLPGVTLPKTGIVYVGMTKDRLDARNHFLAKSSGFHSPRRSLGAILKRVLDLQVVPRAPGPSPKNYDCFSFAGDGERRLSEWMRQNLDYAIVELDGDLRSIETSTILAMEPPLNLTGWPNPQKRHIMDLRSACKSEAKAARHHST